MCDEFGKEDTEYRLLHVYLSPKRAANKGVDLSQEEKDLVYQRQQAAAASASDAAAAAIGAASTPKSKKARCSRKPTSIHRRTQALKQAPGKASRNRAHNDTPLSSTHIMVSTSTSTASPPHYGTAMLVSSPPSLSPLSFDRFPTASSSLSPSSPMYSVPYGGHHDSLHHHLHHYNPPHPGPADVNRIFNNSYPRAFTKDRTAPLVTPVHGGHRRRYDEPDSRRRSSTDEYDTRGPHLSATNYHPDGRQLYETREYHQHNESQSHNLEQSPLRRRESFLDDPRADPFWDGHDPDDKDDQDGSEDKSIHLANTEHEGTSNVLADPLSLLSDKYDRGWQHLREDASPKDYANKSSLLSNSEGSVDGSKSPDPFGRQSNLQPDNAPFEATIPRRVMDTSHPSSSRCHHRRSESTCSSYTTASAMIGVTPDRSVSDRALSPSRTLERRLVVVQRTLRDAVLSQAPEVRGRLVSMVVSWAAQLKLDPLAVVSDEADGGREARAAGFDDKGGAHGVGASANKHMLCSTFIPTNRSSPASASRICSTNNHDNEGSSDSIQDAADERSDQAMFITAVWFRKRVSGKISFITHATSLQL
jgi:hypothetical protein